MASPPVASPTVSRCSTSGGKLALFAFAHRSHRYRLATTIVRSPSKPTIITWFLLGVLTIVADEKDRTYYLNWAKAFLKQKSHPAPP